MGDILAQHTFSCLAISYIKDVLFALYNDTIYVLRLSKLSALLESTSLEKNSVLDSVHEARCSAPEGSAQIHLNFNDCVLNVVTFAGEVVQYAVESLIKGEVVSMGQVSFGSALLRFFPSSESDAALALTGSNELVLVKGTTKTTLLEDVCAVNWLYRSDSDIVFALVGSPNVTVANVNDLGNPIKSLTLPLDESTPLITDFVFFSEAKYVVLASDCEVPTDQLAYVVNGDSVSMSDNIFTVFSMVDRLAYSSSLSLPNWSQTYPELLVGMSSKSEDISLLTPEKQIKPLNDQDMATMPLANDNDTTPLGFVVDVTSNVDVVQPCMGVETSGPLPRIYVLNDYGHLLSWNVWLSADIAASKVDLKKCRDALTSHKPKHTVQAPASQPPAAQKTATSFSFQKPQEANPEPVTTSEKKPAFGSNGFGSSGFGSSGFGSNGFGSSGFGSSGFGSSGFGSSGFGSTPAAKKPDPSIGQGSFGSFANTTSAFGTLGASQTSASPFSDLGSKPSQTTSLFNSNVSTNTTSGFGSSGFSTSGNTTSIFGSSSGVKPEPAKSIFGSSSTSTESPFGTAGKTGGSLFALPAEPEQKPQQPNSIFNSSASAQEKKPDSIFGSFGTTKTNATPTTLFGSQSSAPTTNPFGNASSLGDFSSLSGAINSQPKFSFNQPGTENHNSTKEKPAGIQFDDDSDQGVDSDEAEAAELEEQKQEEQRKYRETAAKLAQEAEEKKAEEERLAKEAAEKKAEEESLAKEAAEKKAEEERLTKEAAEKKVEEERLAKEAAEKAEEERLAKEAAEKKAEEKRLAEEAAEKKVEEERLAKEAKKEANAIEVETQEKELIVSDLDKDLEQESPEVESDFKEVEAQRVKSERNKARLEKEAALRNLCKKQDRDTLSPAEVPTVKSVEETAKDAAEEFSEKQLDAERPIPQETETANVDKEPRISLSVSVDVKPEQATETENVDLTVNESTVAEPTYVTETTSFAKEEYSVAAFEGDEAYLSKFHIPKTLPMLIARGEVVYPEDLSKYSDVGHEIMKMVYDVEAEFMALGQNTEQLSDYLSDQKENNIIEHSLKESTAFPSHWRFFEIGTVVKGMKELSTAYDDMAATTNKVFDGVVTAKKELFTLKSSFVTLGRELENIEKDISQKFVDRNDIDRPLTFEQIQSRRILNKLAADVRTNYERLSEVVLILNSQLHPERIISPQFDTVLSSMQRTIHSHMDILRDLKYEVQKFGQINPPAESKSAPKYSMQLEEDAARSQMVAILSRKRRQNAIFEALASIDLKATQQL